MNIDKFQRINVIDNMFNVLVNFFKREKDIRSGMVVHVCISNTQEEEAGGL
jgi:hypothetical protein